MIVSLKTIFSGVGLNENSSLAEWSFSVQPNSFPLSLEDAHGSLLSGHDGILKTKERIFQCFYWPGMDADISNHLQACHKCQLRRPAPPKAAPALLSSLPQATEPNQRVHADLFGPLKTSGRGKKFILCITDSFTKYVELVALPNKDAETVGNAIFNRWICRYGTMLELVSDNGTEFCNNISKALYKLLQVKHSTTTAYHPQTNAQAEVANKTIAKYLASVVDSNTLDWELYLPPLAFSYNTSFHRSIKATPYFLTYGQEVRLPGFPNPDIRRLYGEDPATEWFQRLQQARLIATQENLQATQESANYFNKFAAPHNYKVGQRVWLDVRNFLGKNRKLAANWEGPYNILKVFDKGVVDLQLPNRVLRVGVQRLKPYISPIGLQTRKTVIEEELPHLPPPDKHSIQREPYFHQNRFAPLTDNSNEFDFDQNWPRDQYWPAPPTPPALPAQPAQHIEPQIDSPQPQLVKRNRGRPRKQPLETQFFEQERGVRNEIEAPTADQAENLAPRNEIANTPRPRGRPKGSVAQPKITPAAQPAENIASPATPPMEMRITRARAAAMERAALPLDQASNLVSLVNKVSRDWLRKNHWGYGPVYESDEYGLPKQRPGVGQPAWVIKRRNYLKKLPVAVRNLLLTGDPLFSFDPVVYDTVSIYCNQTRPPPLPPVLAHAVPYLLPVMPPVIPAPAPVPPAPAPAPPAPIPRIPDPVSPPVARAPSPMAPLTPDTNPDPSPGPPMGLATPRGAEAFPFGGTPHPILI